MWIACELDLSSRDRREYRSDSAARKQNEQIRKRLVDHHLTILRRAELVDDVTTNCCLFVEAALSFLVLRGSSQSVR